MAVTVLLPVIDETTSLRETVRVLIEENLRWLERILIIVCDRTTPAALAAAEELRHRYQDCIEIRAQKRPFLGGARRVRIKWAEGTHVLLMASDLETDPHAVGELFRVARDGYDVVTATRWRGTGGFEGYNPLKLLLNWVFQRMFASLYGVSLSDLTYGFRVFRRDMVQLIEWEELRHPFLLESILKPLRLGARVAEVPTVWKCRVEGKTHNSFWRNFLYFRIALRVLLQSPETFLRKGAPGSASTLGWVEQNRSSEENS